MGVIVQFVYADWAAAYPMYSNVTQQQVEGMVLPNAELLNANDGSGPVCTSDQAKNLLWLMVAHLCQLLFGTAANPITPGGLVGRVSSATQGSVSVDTDWFPLTATSAFMNQTQWGALWWFATAQYRTMRYAPGPQRVFNPWYFG